MGFDLCCCIPCCAVPCCAGGCDPCALCAPCFNAVSGCCPCVSCDAGCCGCGCAANGCCQAGCACPAVQNIGCPACCAGCCPAVAAGSATAAGSYYLPEDIQRDMLQHQKSKAAMGPRPKAVCLSDLKRHEFQKESMERGGDGIFCLEEAAVDGLEPPSTTSTPASAGAPSRQQEEARSTSESGFREGAGSSEDRIYREE